MSETEHQPTIRTAVSVIPPSVGMRSYLSTHHLWAAGHFARLAQAIEDHHKGGPRFDIRHRAYAMTGVLEAVAFLDAAVNELFQDAADAHPSYTGPLDQRSQTAFSTYWRETDGWGSVLQKYQIALGLAGRPTCDRGAEPYQSAALVIRVRNLLVHFRPETVSGTDQQKVEAQVETRFPLNRLMESADNPFFPDKCVGAGCALWAVQSAKALADEVFRRLGLTPNYQRVGWNDDGAPLGGAGA